MINSYAYDVEVLPNFFGITIIDVNDYLNIFKDCHDNSKKQTPIPLTQKYTVKEIKDKLNTIRKWQFYITDKDDSQLVQMIGFINNLAPYRGTDGKAYRSDMFGYNSSRYDVLMVAGLLMFFNQTNTTKELITRLYELSKHIINLQNDAEESKHDYLLTSLKRFALPYTNIDVMTIFALNKVGKGTDSNGNTIYFGKSLKQTSINLQWYELLEYELPPISDKDIDLYQKDLNYRGIDAKRLNNLINKWDRYIIDEWIAPMLHYNENDTFIVCEMIRLFIDEIKLRYSISKSYGINVLSSSRSNIADKMFIKFYSEFSGLAESQWRGKKTERTALAFKRIIFPFIQFKTVQLQELLAEMKQVIIYSVGKKALKEVASKYTNLKYLKTNNDSGWFEVNINKLTYTIATGGLHTQDIPRELKSKLVYINDSSSTGENIWSNITDDSYIYVHWDISDEVPHINTLLTAGNS